MDLNENNQIIQIGCDTVYTLLYPSPKVEITKSLLLPPDQDSPQNISNALNDDCLREVFKRLDVFDLANAAAVCVRFNQHAKKVFPIKFRNIEIKQKIFKKFKITATSLLRNFGPMIESLKASDYFKDAGHIFLRYVSLYCTVLNELHLESFYNLIETTDKLDPLFNRLKTLCLIECELNGTLGTMMTSGNELTKLRINECILNADHLLRPMKAKLEEFYLIDTCINGINIQKDSIVKDFLTTQTSLTKLIIIDDSTFRPAVIDFIGQQLSNLRELKFGVYFVNIENLQILGQLKLLKALSIDFHWKSADSLLASLVQNDVLIERLQLNEAKINNQSINYLTQMKQIKVFGLDDFKGELTDDNLLEIAKELPNLEEMYVKEENQKSKMSIIGVKKMVAHAKKLSLLKLDRIDTVVIDVDDYNAMLISVQNRPEKSKLLIDITSTGDKVNVPEEMLIENRKIFYIEEKVQAESDDDNNYVDYDLNDSDPKDHKCNCFDDYYSFDD